MRPPSIGDLHESHFRIRRQNDFRLALPCAAGDNSTHTRARNYYDDLVVRFDLAPEAVAHLRELGLLYDREADGEFVHFYTATVGEVFFEVVQRHGGYDGYGAANAPVRLAAQRASWARGSQLGAK
jgi:4-hydroxyphenylpyruvate dioxygenase